MQHSLSCSTSLSSFMGHEDVVLEVVLGGVDLQEIMDNDDVSVVGALSKALQIMDEGSLLVMGQLSVFI